MSSSALPTCRPASSFRSGTGTAEPVQVLRPEGPGSAPAQLLRQDGLWVVRNARPSGRDRVDGLGGTEAWQVDAARGRTGPRASFRLLLDPAGSWWLDGEAG